MSRHLFDSAFHPDRSLQLRPPEDERSKRILDKLLALARIVVCVPNEALAIEILEQHIPGRGSIVFAHSGQTHGIRFVYLGFDRFIEPFLEEGMRGVRQTLVVQ